VSESSEDHLDRPSGSAEPPPAPPKRPLLLEITDLHAQFFTEQGIIRAVDGVDLTVAEGEVLGLVGESGCGKSVTSLAIMGLIPDPPGRVVRGRIRFRGQDMLRMREAQLRRVRGNEIAMIFQDPLTSLNPFIKVGRQVAEVLELHQQLSRAKAREEVVRLLGTVGISDPAEQFNAYPHEFSGGMRQRVMIAMALACKPRLLIADEPTSALDVTIQAQILELIGNMREKIKTSIILISHDLGVVAGLADRVAVMYAGRVIEEAPTDSLYRNPQHPYTRGLLRTIPRMDKEPINQLDAIPGRPPNPLHIPGGCPFRPRCALVHEPCVGAYPPVVHVGEDHQAACWALEGGGP